MHHHIAGLQRALRDDFVTGVKIVEIRCGTNEQLVCKEESITGQGLNLRPSGIRPDALPTELLGLMTQ